MTSKKLLTVIQMNDTHAYFNVHQELFWQENKATYRQVGGYAKIATIVQQIRKANEGRVLFLDNGDTLHGTYPAIKTQGAAVVPILNALGIDAMSSHWEFAYGPEVFKKRVEELNFPVLACNVYDKHTKELVFPPYLVKEVNGMRVGLVGIACNIIDKTMPPSFSEGIYFTLGREELPIVVEKLHTKEHVDLIILISHLGFPQDMKLVSEVQGIDLCLSGHTHNRISEPVHQGNTIVIQSGSHGSFIGQIDLEVEDGKITNYKHQMIEVESSIVSDLEITKIIEHELAPFKEKLDSIVGHTLTALNRSTMLESTMDNFLLQSLIEVSGADLAFSNGWRYGAPIIPGPITLNDLYNIIPMNPIIETVKLSGDELVSMLEENLEKTFAADPYEQMGGYIKRSFGLTVYMKIENPFGHRIQQIFINNQPLNRSLTYNTAFVTQQGVPKKYGHQRKKLDITAVEAMQKYLIRHNPLNVDYAHTYIVV